jgi:hypothetical protein
MLNKIYRKLDLPLESTGKEDVLVDDHAVYGVVMDLYLSVGLVRKHSSKVDHSFATS